MSNIPQARELIEQALMTCIMDLEARGLLRRALWLMIRRGKSMKTTAAIIILTALLVALAVSAPAQEYKMPVIPDEATKIRALKRAYELNGNSMVGDGRMIDVSKEDLSGAALPPVSEIPPKKVKKP